MLNPKVKLRTLISFPGAVIDGVGIDVVKENSNYQFNLDFGDFAPPVNSVSDLPNQCALLWNSVTKQYTLAPIAVVTGSVAGNVSGPPFAVVDDIATFSGGTGRVIQDGGSKISDLLPKVGGTITGNLAITGTLGISLAPNALVVGAAAGYTVNFGSNANPATSGILYSRKTTAGDGASWSVNNFSIGNYSILAGVAYTDDMVFYNSISSSTLKFIMGSFPSVDFSLSHTAAAFGISVNVNVASTTPSTNSSSGALTISGGLGVAGAANIGGTLGVTGAANVGGMASAYNFAAFNAPNQITCFSAAGSALLGSSSDALISSYAICPPGASFGLVFIGEVAVNGQSGLYLVSNNAVYPISVTGVSLFEAPTKTPTASHCSIQYDSTTNCIRVYNNLNIGARFRVMFLQF